MIPITKEESKKLRDMGLGDCIVQTMRQHSKSKRGKYYLTHEHLAVNGLKKIITNELLCSLTSVSSVEAESILQQAYRSRGVY